MDGGVSRAVRRGQHEAVQSQGRGGPGASRPKSGRETMGTLKLAVEVLFIILLGVLGIVGVQIG